MKIFKLFFTKILNTLGCPMCYPNRSIRLAGGRTAEELFERTMDRQYQLEIGGRYKVFSIWECQFKQLLKKHQYLRDLYNNESTFVPPPLNPRVHGLRGGRTEAFCMYKKCCSDETIDYLDIVGDFSISFTHNKKLIQQLNKIR